MTEEIDQIETQEETMTIDRTTIINRKEEKKKIENMEDKIGDRTEDSMTTKKMEDIEVTVETIETEETMEETITATTDQGPEGLARGLQASGSLLQATPWP